MYVVEALEQIRLCMAPLYAFSAWAPSGRKIRCICVTSVPSSDTCVGEALPACELTASRRSSQWVEDGHWWGDAVGPDGPHYLKAPGGSPSRRARCS